MRFILLSAITLVLAAQGPAEAQTRSEPLNEVAREYVYYHKAGAGMAAHDEALLDCAVRMKSLQDGRLARPFSRVPGTGVVGQITASIYYGGLAEAASASRIENCMIVRGWTVYRLPEEEGAAIARLDGEAFDLALERLIVSDQPSGVPVRRWANQILSPRRNPILAEPRSPSERHFGFRALERVVAMNSVQNPAPSWLSSQELLDQNAESFDVIPVNLDVRNLPLPEPGRAILLVRVKNGSMTYGPGMRFLQETPFAAGGSHFSYVTPLVGTVFQRRDGKWFAASVPAGRWVVASLGLVTFCMGGPTFEVQPGEVVYAGTFDISGESSGPELDLAPALAAVAGPARERLEIAEYRNGGTYSCGGGLNYALEIPGAPFVEGYAWGSRASSTE